MGIEIERKFLVTVPLNECFEVGNVYLIEEIWQGYLSSHTDHAVRVRYIPSHSRGFLTVKGRQTGASRSEFEYPIPASDAKEILLLCTDIVHKVRYYAHGNRWVIDEFKDAHEGLVIAEIELESEDAVFDKPFWLGREVTSEYEYSSLALAQVGCYTWAELRAI